jgi:hypothetical protein
MSLPTKPISSYNATAGKERYALLSLHDTDTEDLIDLESFPTNDTFNSIFEKNIRAFSKSAGKEAGKFVPRSHGVSVSLLDDDTMRLTIPDRESMSTHGVEKGEGKVEIVKAHLGGCHEELENKPQSSDSGSRCDTVDSDNRSCLSSYSYSDDGDNSRTWTTSALTALVGVERRAAAETGK